MSNQVFRRPDNSYAIPPLYTFFTCSTNVIAQCDNTLAFPSGGCKVRFDTCNGSLGVTVGTLTKFDTVMDPAALLDYRAYYDTAGVNEFLKGLVILIKRDGTYCLDGTVVYTAPGTNHNVGYGTGFVITDPAGVVGKPFSMEFKAYSPVGTNQEAFSQSSNIFRFIKAGSLVSLCSFVGGGVPNSPAQAIQGPLGNGQLTQLRITKISV